MNPIDTVVASRPHLHDVRSCDEWLARAALSDPHHACSSFIELLDELEDAPPNAAYRVTILERLRGPMRAALEQQERRFGSRPLPLGPIEDAAFDQACDLWLAALRAWRELLNHASRDAQLDAVRPLLALRVLECGAALTGAHFVARREVDQSVWHWVHQSYAQAESLRLAETPVDKSGESSTCSALYAEVLLLALAHPYGLSQRELGWTRRWARRWAPKVKLWRAAENGGGYAVDLEGCAPPAWTRAGEPGAALRYLQCSEVARSIRKRLKKLAEGVQPGALGLGRDCTRPAAEPLLTSLLRCWTDAPFVRQFPRRAVQGPVQLASGLDDIYRVLSPAPFQSGAKSWEYSRRSTEQLQIFQRAIEMEQRAASACAMETWETLDESANGFRVRRRSAGMRLAHGQLVALRPRNAGQAMLCEVRWLYENREHALHAGLRALPGLPQPCGVRVAAEQESHAATWSPAFVVPGAAESVSLVLPVGWYQPHRSLELRQDGTRTITLLSLLDRGYDFDRVSFA
ncbi:MAG: hypothetical protein A2W04_00450 [Betaproteobacteria bacterium RBG_16_64_9]|nr:MAG: hypothetical protein A2W04_00450 [Betaproteobacteria bacterium RBG_16_64_9]